MDPPSNPPAESEPAAEVQRDLQEPSLQETVSQQHTEAQQQTAALAETQPTTVFLQVSQGGRPVGKILLELFDNAVPKTCENFRCLCTGERGQGVSGTKLHLKGSKLHRIVRGFMVQGGDITMGNGMGGESIYGETFPVLSMANAGPDSNGSQFFITLAPTPHLDGSHVVFGQVVEGMDVLLAIAETPCNTMDEPLRPVIIADCGQILPPEPHAPPTV